MILAQIEKEVDDEKYILKTFPTMVGLGIQHKMQVDGMSPELTREVIIKGCSKGSMDFDNKSFDKAFAGRYAHMFKLLGEIMKHNFGDMEDEESPNVESDSSEE